MKCLDDCHTYEMETFMKPTIEDLEKILDGPPLKTELLPDGSISAGKTILHFYEMRSDGTKIDGVTNEEFLRVLIHRLHYLNEVWMDGKFGCTENDLAIKYLEGALAMLEARTAGRIARGVEGKMEP